MRVHCLCVHQLGLCVRVCALTFVRVMFVLRTTIVFDNSGGLIKLVEQEKLIRSFSLDGTKKYVVTASDDKLVKVWSLPSLELLASRHGTKQILYSLRECCTLHWRDSACVCTWLRSNHRTDYFFYKSLFPLCLFTVVQQVTKRCICRPICDCVTFKKN